MKRTTNEKGTALIETAITIPIILLVCVGIFEFGRAYQTWEVVTNAAREGARAAVIQGATDTDVANRVNDYLDIGGVGRISTADIAINRSVPLTGSATAAQVQVNYPYQFMVLNPVVRLINPNDSTTGAPITMRATAVMRNE